MGYVRSAGLDIVIWIGSVFSSSCTHRFSLVGYVWSGSFIHVRLGGICMISMICTCMPSVIGRVCRASIMFGSWDMYDISSTRLAGWDMSGLDHSHTLSWVYSVGSDDKGMLTWVGSI